MLRVTTSFALIFAFAAAGSAAEPHQDWMQFLKGDWKYEYSALSSEGGAVEGTATYRLAVKGQSIVARGTEGTDKWAELIGWQPDKKVMSSVGYGSANGNYWVIEYDSLATNRLAGKTWGILPDGRPVEGTVVLERADDDAFEVILKLTSNGEEIKDVGKFRRVSNEQDEKE